MQTHRITLVAVLALMGCYGTSEMQSADTNTNWLKPCEASPQCGAELSCIDEVCALPCTTDATCSRFGNQAECLPTSGSSEICDLACEDDAACSKLGDAFACVSGRCRHEPEEPPSESDAGAEDASAEDASAEDAGPGPVFDAGPTIQEFDENGFITLSTVDRVASPPKVIWSEGRFLVAWASASNFDSVTKEPTSGPPAVDVVEVTSSGVVEEHHVEVEDFAGIPGSIAAINDDDQVVRTTQSDECDTQIVDFRTGAIQVMDVPCEERPASIASIRGSDEWIVASSLERDIRVGRYSSAMGWIAPLEVIGERDDDGYTLDVTTAGNAATVVWGNTYGSWAYLIDDLAALTSGTVSRFDGAVIVDGQYGLAQLDDRVIAVAPFVQRLWTNVLGTDTKAPVKDVIEDALAEDRKPGTAWLAQREVLAVCYTTAGRDDVADDAVSVVLVDRDGDLVEGVGIATDIWNGGGCDLAWSGSELLVAWWDIDHSGAGTSLVRAMRLPVPW
jgi:hypothetical protein